MPFDLDDIILAVIYLAAVFFIFFLGKVAYSLRSRNYNLQREMFENDNFALILAVTGYYWGLVFAIGGIMFGPSNGLAEDLIDIVFYGVAAIVLMHISLIINDKIILSRFDNEKEIIQDRNAGTGAVEAGNCIAVGLIMAGAVSGDGDLLTAIVFLALGQLVLIAASKVYGKLTAYDIHAQIEKDNVAVGVAFAGALIAMGNIIRIGIHGDFISWSHNLIGFIEFSVLGLVMLPIVRVLADWVLLPGATLTHELAEQEKPNVGAGLIEAFSYVAASMMIGWVV